MELLSWLDISFIENVSYSTILNASAMTFSSIISAVLQFHICFCLQYLEHMQGLFLPKQIDMCMTMTICHLTTPARSDNMAALWRQ